MIGPVAALSANRVVMAGPEADVAVRTRRPSARVGAAGR